MIRQLAEAFVFILKSFFDAFSLSGAIIFIFTMFIGVGLLMSANGNPLGQKVWETFTTALTTFVSAKKVSQYEAENQEQLKEAIKTNGIAPLK